MKKIRLLSPLILSMLSLALFAEDLPTEQKITGNSIFAKRTQSNSKSKDCTSCCLPPLNHRLPADFHGYNTFAEALIWQVQEDASEFVATPNNDSIIHLSTPNTHLLGQIQSASFNWNGGIRLGFGYIFARDFWQVLGQYTWYDTSGTKSFTAPTPITALTTEYLMSTFTNITSTVVGNRGLVQAENSVHFTYQMADLLMARRFLVKDQIQLNFSLGATGGYIKENFHIIYKNITTNTYITNNWAFGGGGLRMGIDANWHIIKGFGFFGKYSFAAILGQYGNTNRLTADSPGFTGFATLTNPHDVDVKYKGVFLLPTTQITLGFDWYRAYTNCWISGVRAAVAGEFNYLSNLQQVFQNLSSAQEPNNPGQVFLRDIGSVYMYGANVRLGADF